MTAPAPVVERLAEAVRLSCGEPVLVVYGPGTGDSFVCTDYQERSLKSALWRLLKSAGYDRVVFCSVGEPLYFLDAESYEMSVTGRMARETASRPGEMRWIRGPQGAVSQLRPANRSPRDSRPGGTITIPFAFQTLHSYMRQSDVRTAVVIERTEDFLRHIGDTREPTDRMGEWVQGRNQGNICVLVFSAATMDGVLEAVRDRGPSTALADYVARHAANPQTGACGRVSHPGSAELTRLVHLARVRDGLIIDDWTEVAKLIRQLGAEEPQLARTWLNRLSEIRRLNRRTLNAWVTGEPDDRSALEQLDELIGLTEVKALVRRIAAYAKVQAERSRRDFPTADRANHLIFTGNPGTGKTTVARVIGQLYHELGLLERGHIVAADPSDLVAEHVGGTPAKTNEVVDRALGGVLFLDEAYRLTEKDRGGFNQEALDIILTRMEDDRHRLVVIAAGYTHKMAEFLAANPGLSRRFPNEIEFPDYTPDQLLEILLGMLAKMRHTIDPRLKDLLKRVVNGLYLNRDRQIFGNAGEMRNLAQAMDEHWAERVVALAGRGGLAAAMTEPMTPDDVPQRYREAAR